METKGTEEAAPAGLNLPTGTVTFLFTDIEGSTKLWQAHQARMPQVIARHDVLMRETVESNGGAVFRTVGDAVHAAFPTASSALAAALAGQRALRDERWEGGIVVRVRMAVHTGAADVRDGDYLGHTLNRVARLLSAGHGGQTLLSEVTRELLADQLPGNVELADMGVHRLKDLERPEHIFQVVAPDLPSGFAPLVTADARRTNLLPEHTPFVGREGDVRAVADLLRSDNVRLVTLTGPGGTGKTRLALRVATVLADHFRDGAYFVELAPVTDASLVAGSIAAALGIKEVPEQPVDDTLRAALADKQMLLLLDNFEHLLAAESLVAGLLAAPGLTILVTSRAALRLSAEREYAVPPLAVPDPQHLPEVERLLEYDAVALFVQRAQATKADFAITEDNAGAIAEICFRLDGLPLAIELAAARVRLFPPQALLRRLDRRLQLLTGGARDLPARQQTLRAALDWSYQLLEPGEQRLLDVLSVFAGATLEAVDEVVGSMNGTVGITGDTLDTLTSLADNSLIRQSSADGDEPRVAMLETIREYAAERLSGAPDLRAAALRAHAVYFSGFAQRLWKDFMQGSREPAWAALTAETDNLRIAWHYWVGERDLDELNKIVDSLWRIYDSRGWYRATLELVTELLEVLSSLPPTPERKVQEVTLRIGLARTLLVIQGYTQEVEDAYTRALDTVGEDRELPQVFPVLRALANLNINRSKFGDAARIGQEILQLAETQHNPSIAVDGYLLVGSILTLGQDPHGGLEQLDRAIAGFEAPGFQTPPLRIGSSPGIAALTTSGFALWFLGYPDQAVERDERAIDRAREMEHPLSIAYACFHTGLLHWWRREPERARDRAMEVLDVAGAHDLTIWRAVGTVLIGAAKTGLGQADEGLAEIHDGIAQYQGLRTPQVFWPFLLHLRAVACSLGEHAQEGLQWIDRAIEITGTEATFVPELYLQKGNLLLAVPGTTSEDADDWLLRAFEQAKHMDARMLQLRAALGLCRSQPNRAAADRGCELLRSVYASFTEGFASPDLVDARDRLHELGHDSASQVG